MQVRIENSSHRILIGKKVEMTYANNQTMALWKAFMPRRNEIKNRVNEDLISMQVYPESFSFSNFDINAPFEKWAAAEVSSFDSIPDEMECFTLGAGLYAVFEYKGLNTNTSIFQYIFGTWLPASDYVLDQRQHFEILGSKYKNNDPESEEEIWIPIKLK
ncbi:MAG: GyrI-like domain-containing protein [Chitinophagaceae bacterium]|nr:GyrI-like domain-containing protein [Chitinophagaceae bacterium]